MSKKSYSFEEQLKAENEPISCGDILLRVLFWGVVLSAFGHVMANRASQWDNIICLGSFILFCVLAFLGAKSVFWDR
jgi:hypothetical protein